MPGTPSAEGGHCRHALYAALCTVAAVWIAGCASGQGIPPPGGPPDTTAPAVAGSVPAPGSVNVEGRTVSIRFSEYMREETVQAAVVVTPIPKNPPSYDWSGSTMDITLGDTLQPGRTYAITVGSGAADLSGNRLGRPYTLRFSTGPTIDSGRIIGQVIGVTGTKGYVAAYAISPGRRMAPRPDSAYPDALAPLGDDGTFRLEALPTGTYRLYAFTDELGDQLYSPGTDAIGLAGGDLIIQRQGGERTGVLIRMRRPDDITAPSLYSATGINTTRTDLRFSEPMDTAGIRPETISLSSGGRTYTVRSVWKSTANRLALSIGHQPLSPGMRAEVHVGAAARDTAGNALPDSASRAGFTVPDLADTASPLLTGLSADSMHAYIFPDSVLIWFDEPAMVPGPDSLLTLQDSARTVRIPFRLRPVTPTAWAAYPGKPADITGPCVLELRMGGVSDLAGNHRDTTLRIKTRIAPARQNGTLQGSLTDSAAPGALHVILARNVETGREYKLTGVKSGPWEFRELPDGDYQISGWRDTNDDGIYDYGSVLPYRPAEVYVLFRGPVRVRPRWVTDKVDMVIPGTAD